MRNAFMFDSKHEVKAYIKKLKGIVNVEFLDVRARGDHFLKCTLSFSNGITRRPYPFIG